MTPNSAALLRDSDTGSSIEVSAPPLLQRLMDRPGPDTGLNPKQKAFVTYGSRSGENNNVALVGGTGKGGSLGGITRGMMLNLDAYENNPLPIANRGFIGMWDKAWLYKTTIQDFLAVLDEFRITYEPLNPRYEAMFTVPAMKFQILWGQTDDHRRLSNANVGWVFVDQAENGTPWESILKLNRRLRYPGVYHSLFCNLNAFPKGHWIETEWPRLGHTIFSDLFDNERYYRKEAPDFITSLDKMNDVERAEFVEGTMAVLGKRIYPMASKSKHGMGPGILQAVSSLPLGRAWDYGTQACLVGQKQRNRMVYLKEWMGEFGEPLRNFKERVYRECEERWPGYEWDDVDDPSGRNKDVTKSLSAYEIMGSHPYPIRPRPANNDLAYGHELCREMLNKEEEGIPLMVADLRECPVLVDGWTSGYVCKDRAEGLVLHEIPVDNFYKHLQDDARYLGTFYFKLKVRAPDKAQEAAEARKVATARALEQATGLQRMLLERREGRGRRKVEVGV